MQENIGVRADTTLDPVKRAVGLHPYAKKLEQLQICDRITQSLSRGKNPPVELFVAGWHEHGCRKILIVNSPRITTGATISSRLCNDSTSVRLRNRDNRSGVITSGDHTGRLYLPLDLVSDSEIARKNQ
jgi:hypothetical protein